MKKRILRSTILVAAALLFSCPLRTAKAEEPTKTPETTTAQEKSDKKEEAMVSRAELDRLKKEWEEVREQQIEMIRAKEDELEALKEQIFSKIKGQIGAAEPMNKAELEAQKKALQEDRQKFFSEMNRQKESLRQLQASLDEKAKKLEGERARFEQEKKAAAF
jgi:PBP1b-binding outer membrane lipoprotein LpoB